MARPVRCVIMRGGTSKAVFLREADLPVSPEARLQTILAIFGSPDARQIDGLGGADPLTSKVAIIGPVRAGNPRAAHTHLTYTFGQVEIDAPSVDYISLCGNISSAVGAYAVYEGLVEPTGAGDHRSRLQHEPRSRADPGGSRRRRPAAGAR